MRKYFSVEDNVCISLKDKYFISREIDLPKEKDYILVRNKIHSIKLISTYIENNYLVKKSEIIFQGDNQYYSVIVSEYLKNTEYEPYDLIIPNNYTNKELYVSWVGDKLVILEKDSNKEDELFKKYNKIKREFYLEDNNITYSFGEELCFWEELDVLYNHKLNPFRYIYIGNKFLTIPHEFIQGSYITKEVHLLLIIKTYKDSKYKYNLETCYEVICVDNLPMDKVQYSIPLNSQLVIDKIEEILNEDTNKRKNKFTNINGYFHRIQEEVDERLELIKYFINFSKNTVDESINYFISNSKDNDIAEQFYNCFNTHSNKLLYDEYDGNLNDYIMFNPRIQLKKIRKDLI